MFGIAFFYYYVPFIMHLTTHGHNLIQNYVHLEF